MVLTDQELDEAFTNMLEATHRNNVSLNYGKKQHKQPYIPFCSNTLTQKGMQPVAGKLNAVHNMKTPCSGKELQTIMAMVKDLNHYSVKFIELGSPLCQHTEKYDCFRWEPHHQTALDNIKKDNISPSPHPPFSGEDLLMILLPSLRQLTKEVSWTI